MPPAKTATTARTKTNRGRHSRLITSSSCSGTTAVRIPPCAAHSARHRAEMSPDVLNQLARPGLAGCQVRQLVGVEQGLPPLSLLDEERGRSVDDVGVGGIELRGPDQRGLCFARAAELLKREAVVVRNPGPSGNELDRLA